MRLLTLFFLALFLVTCTANTPPAVNPPTPFPLATSSQLPNNPTIQPPNLTALTSPPPTPTALAPAARPTRTPRPAPTTDVNKATVQDPAQRNTTFALTLYRQTAAQNDDNLIFSPYSISLAFSMLYAGARGNTETQLADTFHYLPQDAQHTAFRLLAARVNTPPKFPLNPGDVGAPFQLNIANATWVQKSFPLLAAFTTILRDDYNAEPAQVDFAQNAPQITNDINAWIANATNARIKNLVGPGVITPDTRLVLVNAVYFKGSWQFTFKPEQTKNGTFTLADNTTVQVPLMSRAAIRMPYLETADYQAARFPYVGSKADMVLLLPREGRFQAVETNLTPAALSELNTAQDYLVDLTMPHWKFKSNLQLPDLLKSLGVTDAFDSRADFSGLSQGGGLFVDAAIHQATIGVNEEGTEAAAASAIALPVSEPDPAILNLNRPFLFAIIERETGSILFLGRVMNPTTP